MISQQIYTLENCAEIHGVAVVIDVLRAYTTAAFAFESGAAEIILAGTPAEAFALREQFPELWLMGEVDGRPIPGFNLSNSPTEIRKTDLTGRRMVLRTSAGTQGVLRSTNASSLLAASLVNLSATVSYIQQIPPVEVGFVATGIHDGYGDEDIACAEAAIAILNGHMPDSLGIQQRVRSSLAAQKFNDREKDFPASDLEAALEIDRFNFAMVVQRRAGLYVLTRATVG